MKDLRISQNVTRNMSVKKKLLEIEPSYVQNYRFFVFIWLTSFQYQFVGTMKRLNKLELTGTKNRTLSVIQNIRCHSSDIIHFRPSTQFDRCISILCTMPKRRQDSMVKISFLLIHVHIFSLSQHPYICCRIKKRQTVAQALFAE